MIEFSSVSVRYRGSDRPALEDVSFIVPPLRVTAVAGPNGSGKSTLVRALLRRVDLLSGSISVDSEDISAITPRDLAVRIAVTPQREELAFSMSVEEYVALARYPSLGLWQSPGPRDKQAVTAAMERAGVAEFAQRATDALSGGEWQRVRIARALAQSASFLVLDEPTTFLDLSHEMALFELLHNLAREGMGVMVVSHQLNLLSRFADSVVLLHRGKVAASGTPDDVMRASLLEKIYEWPLVVSRDPAVGAPSLVPLRRPTGLEP
jgi:iron complex transport system ATP-binding protein